MAKASSNNLPAYTTVENMLLLLDVLKRKTKEDEVKTIFGKGSTLYAGTKSALRVFDLIKEDSLGLTEKGRKVAYSQEADKKHEMQSVLVSYPAYEMFLLNLLQKESLSITEVDEIINFWGKANNGSTERNREDGAMLFMSIIDYLELGKFVKGRGSNATRIEWSEDAKVRLGGMLESLNDSEVLNESEQSREELVMESKDVNDECLSSSSAQKASGVVRRNQNDANIVNSPQITINVDMSNWDEERIKIFFKYAYGQF